jgi:hypothetical protein
MAIERTQPVTNSLKGFNIVNQRESNDFAFIHDANEIKYAASKYVYLRFLRLKLE